MRPRIWISAIILTILVAIVVFKAKDKHEAAANVPSVSATTNSSITPLPASDRRLARKAAAKTNLAPAEITLQENAQHLQLLVQNETGEPQGGAEVRVKVKAAKANSEAVKSFNRTVTTDGGGLADILFPADKLEALELTVTKDDYASRKITWNLKTGDTVPASYTLKLKAPLHVGGIVVDPEGNPIAGAEVAIYRFWTSNPPPDKGEKPALSREKTVTGQDGRWKIRNLPMELVGQIMASASHKDFIGTSFTISDQSLNDLQKETHKFVLKRGNAVRGLVLDQANMPIAQATVWAGKKYTGQRQDTKSDAEGRFSFQNVKEGDVMFCAMADGFAPTNESYEVSAQTPEIVFRLVPGVSIGGIVQNEAGEPIEGARVVLAGSYGDPAYDIYEFSQTTGRDGRFNWASAPNQTMPFYIGKSGYEQKRDLRLKPGADNVITLRHERQVQGQVLDAETSQPVTKFRVSVGRKMGDEQYYADHGATDFTNPEGLFTMDIGEEQNNGIQVSAKDYAEQTQYLPEAKDGKVQIVIKLKASLDLQGRVVTPDGQPVAGATVALRTDSQINRTVTLKGGRLQNYGNKGDIVTTDESGHFELPSPPEETIVIAAKGNGFGSSTIAEVRASGTLILQSFGSIEGVIIRGNVPGAGQELLLTTPGLSLEFQSYKTIADADGRFSFTNVPPGTLSIVRLVKTTPNSWSHSQGTEVVVEAGKTTQVTLGGTDATLQGHVIIQGELSEKGYIVSGRLSSPFPQFPEGLSPEQNRAYQKTPAWKERMKTYINHAALMGPDGSLLFDSVPPGQYTVNVEAKSRDERSPMAKVLASGKISVTVPEGSDPASPIDIGQIVITPEKQPQ